jgi:protein-S-isoprenylcysteine O-methyltransferase Ste14
VLVCHNDESMNAKILIIIGFSYLYGVFEVWMNLRQRKKSLATHSGDKGSLWLLYILITLGYILSFSIGATTIGRVYAWDTLFAVGAVCVVLGLFLRIRAIITLKAYFTYSVTTVEGHKLIETGLYKYIRHPGYLGQILIFTGISISLANWLSFIFMLVPVTIGYIYRITIEERFMVEQLGDKYLDYQKRTKRILPMLY